MNYVTYLKNKNLSKNTIEIYSKNYKFWKTYIGNKTPTKRIFVGFIREYEKKHKAASVHLLYSSVISCLKFEKRWKLVNECRDIKLPTSESRLRTVISLEEFYKIANNINLDDWHDKRDWMIFCFMFQTGVRVSELIKIDLTKIENNKLCISGKGKKTRIIYINNYLNELLKNWKYKKIAISKKRKSITSKQVNILIKRLTLKYFDKCLTSHGLRRSFATNMLKSNINLEVVRRTLGHANINTTSRYIQYTDDDILCEINNIFKK